MRIDQDKYQAIVKALESGMTYEEIVQLYSTSKSTVSKIKSELNNVSTVTQSSISKDLPPTLREPPIYKRGAVSKIKIGKWKTENGDGLEGKKSYTVELRLIHFLLYKKSISLTRKQYLKEIQKKIELIISLENTE